MTPFLHTDERDFARFTERGDARALARVFDRNAPSLLALARHLAPDASAAEDLVQATFLTAIEKRATFDPARRVAPWLCGILARHAWEARRRASRDLVDARGRAPDEEALDAHDPLADALAAEREAALRDLLAGLPERDAAVLVPHLVEGASAAEIARRVGASAGAVHVRLHRALRRLGRRLPPALAPAALATLGAGGRGLEAVRAAVLERAGGGRGAAFAGPPVSPAIALASASAIALGVAAVALAGRGDASAHPVADVAATQASTGPALVAAPPASAQHERTVAVGGRPAAAAVGAAAGTPLSVTCIVQTTRDSSRIPGASAWLRSSGDAEASLLARSDSSEPLRFSLADGDLARLEVRAPGHVTWRAPADDGFRAERLYGDWTEDPHTRRATFNPFLRPARRARGRVVDPAGQPVPGAALFVVGAVPGLALPLSDGVEATAGADGSFDLPDVVPQGAPDGCALLAVDDSVAGAPPRVGWVSLDGEAQDSTRDLVLRLGHAVAAEVQALDAHGVPVAGVRLRALPLGGPWAPPRATWEADEASQARRWPAPWRAATEAVTDAAGVTRFAGLPALDAASHASSRTSTLRIEGVEQAVFEVVGAEADWRTLDAAQVLVPTSEARAGEWLSRGASASSLAPAVVRLERVRRGTVAGVVRDPAGAPLAGVRVELEGLTHPAPERTTAEDGAFAFEDVDLARAARLSVAREGHVTLRCDVPSVEPDTLDLRLAAALPFRLIPMAASFGSDSWRLAFSQGQWASGRYHALESFLLEDAPAGALEVELFLDHGRDPVARGSFVNDGRATRIERALDRLLASPELMMVPRGTER